MSHLHNLPIKEFKEMFGLDAILETGTRDGTSIDAGIEAGYKLITSCDIDKGMYENAVKDYRKYPGVKLFLGDSATVMTEMLKTVKGKKTLFWLDGHISEPFEQSKYKKKYALPLQSEIDIIKKTRNIDNDVIIIDDLNFYFREFHHGIEWWTRTITPTGALPEPEVPIYELTKRFPNHDWFFTTATDIVAIFVPILNRKRTLLELIKSDKGVPFLHEKTIPEGSLWGTAE